MPLASHWGLWRLPSTVPLPGWCQLCISTRCWALASFSEDTVRAHQWQEAQQAGLGPGFIRALPQPILVSTTGRASLRSPQGLVPWGAPLLPGLPPSKQAPFKCLLHTVPMTLFQPRKASLLHGIAGEAQNPAVLVTEAAPFRSPASREMSGVIVQRTPKSRPSSLGGGNDCT